MANTFFNDLHPKEQKKINKKPFGLEYLEPLSKAPGKNSSPTGTWQATYTPNDGDSGPDIDY
jgi:hypothetical protein